MPRTITTVEMGCPHCDQHRQQLASLITALREVLDGKVDRAWILDRVEDAEEVIQAETEIER